MPKGQTDSLIKTPTRQLENNQAPSSRATDEVLIRIQKLSKYYHEFLAVDSVDLDIHKGEIFALLGASGSGKSTLLRMLAGFETPSSGKILLRGEDITGLAPNHRPFNMMFQSYALFPHMSVEKNIAFGLHQDNLSKADINERVAELLALVRMEKYAKRKPDQLSGGQRQRVALARSLARQPQLLLLDEPMGALDNKLRTQMQLELVDIIERVGVTCIMVTHDQEEAMTMANRIAIMDQGYIEQVGSPTDIYESPHNRMVAEFIGAVNIFETEIMADDQGSMTLRSSDMENLIHVGHGVSSNIEDKAMLFALRPEKTLLSTEKPSQAHNWTTGIVSNMAYLGGHSIYYVRLNSGKVIQSVWTNTDRRAERPTWGDTVYLYWSEDSGIVLHP
jgi:putrescine transport system ATP-binding protein